MDFHELFYKNWREKNRITIEGYNLNKIETINLLKDYEQYLLSIDKCKCKTLEEIENCNKNCGQTAI